MLAIKMFHIFGFVSELASFVSATRNCLHYKLIYICNIKIWRNKLPLTLASANSENGENNADEYFLYIQKVLYFIGFFVLRSEIIIAS